MIAKTALIEPYHSVEDSAGFDPVFASMDISAVIFF
jgi:hypothetical protein